MTSRERVQKTLAHQPADRIPNGLGGCETAGLHILAYDKLKKILGVNHRLTRVDTFMFNAVFEIPILEAIHGDIVLLASPRMCPGRLWGPANDRDWKDQSLWNRIIQVPISDSFKTDEDGSIWWTRTGTVYKCPSKGIFFDPVASHSRRENTPDYHPPCVIPDELLRKLEEAAKWLYENTSYAINCGETIEDLQLQPGGSANWWMRMLDEPDIVHELLDEACEAGLSQLKLLDQAIGKYTDMLSIAHDFGDLRGVTIGPALWREIYKPHYQKLFAGWHQITKMKINFHSCGSIADILPDLVECGVDVLNPLQISARGMEPSCLKKEFGDKLIFYGGSFDSVQTQPNTPPEIVYETVKNNIMELSKNGGYIFAGVHNIPGDIPESHLIAILEAYNDCCKKLKI